MLIPFILIFVQFLTGVRAGGDPNVDRVYGQVDSSIIYSEWFVAAKSKFSEKDFDMLTEYKPDSIISLLPTNELIYHIEEQLERQDTAIIRCSKEQYTYKELKNFIRCYGVFYDRTAKRLRVVVSFSFFHDQEELKDYLKIWQGEFFMILHQRTCRNFLIEYELDKEMVKVIRN